MTVRNYGPTTPKVAPRNAADVEVFLDDGKYNPDLNSGTVPTFSTGIAVSSGAITFAINDNGTPPIRLIMRTTNASGQVQTQRVVLGSNTSGKAAVTAGAAAGTSPTGVAITGHDANSQVTVTTGSSPATGTLLHVQFAKTQPAVPAPVIGSGNSASEVCSPSVTNVTAFGYDIVVGVAASASAPLVYNVTFDPFAPQSGNHPSEGSTRLDPSLGADGSMDAGTPHG